MGLPKIGTPLDPTPESILRSVSGYSTVPSAFLTGFEYRTLNKPFVSILGLVMKKLIRKKPPNKTNINMCTAIAAKMRRYETILH